MENIFVEFLPPWVETGLQPAFYDKESGTVLQQTARMYARVNMLIRMFNKLSKNTKETVEDYINRFNELYNYVHDYFDNLDVQEEINNKLDAMVEDGTLESILQNYTSLQKQYDTVLEAIADTTLVDGSFIKCYGYANKNDGYGGEFKVTDNATNIELDNGLYLEALNDYENNYYNNITYTKERHNETDCYFVEIPLNDEFNNQIDLHLNYRDYDGQTPLQYAEKNLTNVTINAGLTWITENQQHEYPFMIGDGEVLSSNDLSEDANVQDEYVYLCFSEDRSITTIPVKDTPLSALTSQNYTQVFDAYFQIIDNGVVVDFSTFGSVCKNIATKLHPRQVIGIKNDKTIIIMSCDGRNGTSLGLTSTQCAQILIGKGCINAWNLDGGGSTSLNYKGVKVNGNVDDDFTTDRYIRYTLNVKSKEINKNLSELASEIGSTKQDLLGYLMPLIPFVKNVASYDCDDISPATTIYYSNSYTNSPYDEGGWLISLPNPSSDENRTKYGKQIFIPRNRQSIYFRHMWNGSWGSWNKLQNLLNYGTLPAHTIVTSNTYEKVTPSTLNAYSGDDVMVVNDDDTFSIRYNDGGAVKLQLQGRVDPANTNTKYIKITKNGSDVRMCQLSNLTGLFSFSLLAPVKVTNVTDKFAIEVQGSASDKFSQLSLTISS